MSLLAQIVIALILLVAGFGGGVKYHSGVIAQRDLAARDARESDERQQRALGDRKAVQHASTLANVNNQLGAARAHIATIDSRQCLDADTVRVLNNIGSELPTTARDPAREAAAPAADRGDRPAGSAAGPDRGAPGATGLKLPTATTRDVATALAICRTRHTELASQLNQILDIEDARHPPP